MAAKTKSVPREARPEKPIVRAGTIALLGRPNVGKSTLLNALLGERIAITSHHAQTTRDRIAGIVTRDGVQFVFLDTPGFHQARHKLGERMNEVARAAAADCDVALFMTEPDVRRSPSNELTVSAEVRSDDRRILAAIPDATPVVVVVNKIDKLRPKALLFPMLEAYGKERERASLRISLGLVSRGASVTSPAPRWQFVTCQSG